MGSQSFYCNSLSQKLPSNEESITKLKSAQQDSAQMTSSIISANSSLTSPVDSGVQLLDSESEIVSLMSISGLGCDFDISSHCDNTDDVISSESGKSNSLGCKQNEIKCSGYHKSNLSSHENLEKYNAAVIETKDISSLYFEKPKINQIMTKSDIDNHNTHLFDKNGDRAVLPVKTTLHCITSLPAFDSQELDEEVFELEPIILQDEKADDPKSDNTADDLMNVSLTSYELLDYTLQNMKVPQNCSEISVGMVDDIMHVSMSEEVNESLTLNSVNEVQNVEHVEPQESEKSNVDDQIVFRRQRRKKSKSDTPKKRVSFHEDILNSTKIDDVHINHGFITHESDISVSFFERGFIRKPDVVKGRYSWAAEGDAPYYQKNNEREVKSDIYVNNVRFSSTSSSSSASISSSLDEEDSRNSDEGAVIKKEPTQKLPKSSCLKKTSHKKYIKTNIVEEESVGLKKKKSETNLLDSNIFGSLKSIFAFSSSVPLAERGVPEGQEDISVYSTSDSPHHMQANVTTIDFTSSKIEPPAKKISNLNLDLTKTNLKLTKSEGFYPNYPSNQNLPPNIILCDSNVYEHRGISYSYEYENFQKTFEKQNKPKSSTIYQTLLKELNFFKRKEKKAIENEAKENFEFLNMSTPIKENSVSSKVDEFPEETRKTPTNGLKKYASSATIDFSDSDSMWDFNETSSSHGGTRHLNSPKRKPNKVQQYYSNSLVNSKQDLMEMELELVANNKSLFQMKPSSSTSKTSLINKFLRSVTLKKVIDLKLQKKMKHHRKCMSLYLKNVKFDMSTNEQLDAQIEKEILEAKERKQQHLDEEYDTHFLYKFKNDVFRCFSETLLKIFPVNSSYTTQGESKPLMIVLSSTTLYVTGFKANHSYSNHFVIPYTELNSVLIGPNAQTIHISNYDHDMQCIIVTGSETLTNDIIGQLEIAMRRDINKPKLLAVKQLNMQDMINLRRAICKQTVVSKDEEYFHYSIINIQDYNSDVFDTPLGPNKEGPLMFKTNVNESRWETAYFILKAGILYMLSSPSHRLPMRVLPLINGACQGARRIYNYSRPHTFQIQSGNTLLLLAAPDEYVASEWLQALVHAASKSYNHREKLPTQNCTLLMTSDHILTVREAFPCSISSSLTFREEHQPIKGLQALSCASISDITAFRLPCAEQSWCILEFACREVHESSGDWILYFASNSELEKFISTLEMLWAYHNEQGECFPISTIPETDNISKKCSDTFNTIQNSWLSLQMNLKSF